jgi:SOS-response transcriptional repressor LexA
MTNPAEIKQWLTDLGKDRDWLAHRVGVPKRTLDNWFSRGFPDYALRSIAMVDTLEKRGLPQVPDDAIHLPMPLSKELLKRAAESGFGDDYMGYVNELLRHALARPSVLEEKKADSGQSPSAILPLHSISSKVAEDEGGYKAFKLPFLGAVAAGEPVCAPQNETVMASRQFPRGHFVVEINGRSAEPLFMDGDRWVISPVETGTPKQGVPCVVSDGSGSYLKKWNPKRRVFESINPDFDDVIPGEEAKLQGYPVEKLA